MKEELEEKPVFRLILSVEADSFLQSIPEKAREKVRYNIRRIQKGEQNKELFKKLDGKEIWEFRTLFNKIVYRLFAFWDTETETLVIATHGIIKKTQKTPSKEIAKAEEVRKLYFEHKKKK
ncbi:MAG: type II toxin-antitoxin system RelE/ParE family toxin [Prevotella sp.]|nr:type II toxin-antitoxin system RelE/ParE family toxin [Prevotella sp.]